MRRAGLLAMLTVAGAACATSSGVSFVSTADIQSHPEAALTYPVATNVTYSVGGELDTPDVFGRGPQPASAETRFYTSDRVDRVIAWYDEWLSSRGWLDAIDQGNGNRRWERGVHEDFFVDCSYEASAGQRICLAEYILRSAHFAGRLAAAPPLGDPVSGVAVAARHVGLLAAEGRVQYDSGPPIPMTGTPAADAARARWPTQVCCASPVILDDSAMPETATRSAYHAVLLEVAEYNRPDVQGGAFGNIQRDELQNLVNAGFLLENVGLIGVNGQAANVYLYERGPREAVILSISYGAAAQGTRGIAYRVATLRIVYDVAPKACDLSRPDCFEVLAGTANVVWSHA